MKLTVKRPMMVAAIGSCIVVVLFYYFREYSLLLCVSLIVLFGFLLYKRIRVSVLFCTALVIVVSLSMLTRLENLDEIDDISGQAVNVRLVAAGDSKTSENIRIIDAYVLESEILPKYSSLSLVDYDCDIDISAGAVFEAFVEIESVRNSKYELLNLSQNRFAEAKALNIYEPCGECFVFSSVQSVRDYVSAKLFSNLSSDTASTLLAVLTGNKDFLDDELSSGIKSVGVSHVMAVSGLHFTIILNGIFFFVGIFFNNRYLKSLITVIFAVLITAVCGFTMSVIRAAVMSIITALAPIFKRDRDSLSALSFTVVLVLLTTPFAVFNVAFQLSSLATFGIVYIAPFFDRGIKSLNIPNFLKNILSCIINTLSATVVTLPITIYVFGTVSLISPVTNVLITYPVTVMLLFTTAVLIVDLFPLLGFASRFLYFVCGVSAKYVNHIISRLADIPFAAVAFDSNKDILICTVISAAVSIGVSVAIAVIEALKYKRYLALPNEAGKKG